MTVEMSGENSQGWITEGAFFSLTWYTTSATAQGGKNEPIVTCGET